MRLAYFSPLPPAASGIADYSAELLPYLAAEIDVELFADAPAPSVAGLPVHSYRSFAPRAAEFDLPVYHMGNSPLHAYIYATAQQIPGLVVLHDVVLHHLLAWLTVDRGDARGYVELMRAAYGAAGAELAEAETRGQAVLSRFDFPLCEEVVRGSRAVLVHSEYAAKVVAAIAPGKPCAVVPMGVPLPSTLTVAEARARLDLDPDEFLISAFGEVHAHKRITIALEAFAEFHRRHPASRLFLVGRVSPNYDVAGLVRSLGLESSVRALGYVPRDRYEALVAASEVCLNLRYPSAGETSASVLRLLGAGRPVIVTRTGAYAELPDGVCLKIEPDAFERDLFLACLELLFARPELAHALGAQARRYVAAEHTLEGAARGYIEFARTLTGAGPQRAEEARAGKPARGGEREGEGEGGESERQVGGAGVEPGTGRVKEPILEESGNVIGAADEAPGEVMPAVAQALAELGIGPEDPLVDEVAQAWIEIDSKGFLDR